MRVAASGWVALAAVGAEFKAIYVASFRRDQTREQAGRYWTEVHAPMADPLDGMVGYIQSHVVGPVGGREEPAGGLRFDGYACEWWRDRETFEAGMASEDWATIVADGPEFLDVGALAGTSLVIDEHVLREGPFAPYKLAFLLRFKDDLEVSDAAEHWLRVHGPLGLRVPGVVRYVQNHVVGSLAAGGVITGERARFDGIAEMWYEDEAAWLEASSTEAAAEVYRGTFEFVDSSASLSATVVERIIKPRG